ncbi:copper chaperone [Schistosoma japonicum]|uniref:Copper transport protein ATOX1 n=1 Tax=Schistosoma japonicum TaxID=6182 RepID=Q5BQT7_SCHJA|nr:SJCHGC09814 protein [Schistosoma japonicum]KAH8877531.1 copper chaperone [Schistosoma japonicum]CAX70132.1 Heavy metal transport/detoxification protein,domain-containing protein [Schistosoma japonicum]CAX70133.1 Heavy metal transport/detoxification protein,domain-containing protein [Schistosoma japonicum]CAX74510.1 Heavy metal transport/detoxification protein,domain-containing protein [Schistosoma japonicum]
MEGQIRTYTFNMEMSCEGCAKAAKRVLMSLGDAIKEVEANVQSNTITVQTTLPADDILHKLEETQKKIVLVSS